MYVCLCFAVTDNEVKAEISLGARSVEEVGERCGAGTGCGSCQERICELLEMRRETNSPTVAAQAANR